MIPSLNFTQNLVNLRFETMNKIIKKPWGQEELIDINNKSMMKKLTMNEGHRCSTQFHNKKKETIYVLSGKLKISIGSNVKTLASNIYKSGDNVTIPPKLIHRMEAIEDSIYLEASTPEMDDVVRLEDDYKRNIK